MKTYDLAKKFIIAKTYTKEDISKRVNMFYMFNQLTDDEYQELIELIETTYAEKAE